MKKIPILLSLCLLSSQIFSMELDYKTEDSPSEFTDLKLVNANQELITQQETNYFTNLPNEILENIFYTYINEFIRSERRVIYFPEINLFKLGNNLNKLRHDISALKLVNTRFKGLLEDKNLVLNRVHRMNHNSYKLSSVIAAKIFMGNSEFYKFEENANDLARKLIYILISASKKGAFNLIKSLIKDGANVNYMDGYGYTPLMRAACFKIELGTKLVKLFIKHGAALNFKDVSFVYKDTEHKTALSLALINFRNPESIKILVEAGAYLTAENINELKQRLPNDTKLISLIGSRWPIA